MKPFIFTAVLFATPVMLKAYLLVGYQLFCLTPTSQPFARPLLPLLLLLFGYFIFILEGAQSSVILANKHSSETLHHILESIDISKQRRQRATRVLSRIINGAKIDNFIIGRQLLIIALAFLFKLSYDSASLTPTEAQALSQGQTSCFLKPDWIRVLYSILDSWLFSTFLCSVFVAYFFQVPSKLMAQYYPMRFLTTVPLSLQSPVVSQWVGALSQLGRALDALRKRGELRMNQNEFSYFCGKEPSPVSTEQLFQSLADTYGEYVNELTVTLCPESPQNQNVWFVEDETRYKVVKPNSEFSQTIQVPNMSAFTYNVFAEDVPGRNRRLPLSTNEQQYHITPVSGGPQEVLSRVYARFGATSQKVLSLYGE